MKKNNITAESLQGLGSTNARIATKVLAFDPVKDADKITQGATMGIVLNEGDKFIINQLVMTETQPQAKNSQGKFISKVNHTLALAISRVIDGVVSDKVELLPMSRFVSTLIDIPQTSVSAAIARINEDDRDHYKDFLDYVEGIRSDKSKVYYKGEGAVPFAKDLLAKSGTDAKANVFTVEKFHSHTATFEYSPAEAAKAERNGATSFSAVQQYYVLSVA